MTLDYVTGPESEQKTNSNNELTTKYKLAYRL